MTLSLSPGKIFPAWRSRALLAACAALLVSAQASADPLGVANEVRRKQCGKNDAPALMHTPALDVAARAIAEGKTLRAAIDASGYRAVHSTVLVLEGTRDDQELARLVAQSCAQLADPRLRDAGSFRRGSAVWILLAEPFTAPSLDTAATVQRLLELVNAARAQPRRCGNEDFAAAPPLRWSTALQRAAAEHARDMAERGTMSHTGRDGSVPAQRVSRAGYDWVALAENVAAGQRDADAVVKSWLASPGHCANLMHAGYTETGAAFATNSATTFGIYWTQVFATRPGAPKKPSRPKPGR